jgi:hypothetical protein
MSFGFSIGDFVAVGQLTWTVYRSCKGAPGEFQELSRELSSLHTILHELEDEAKSPSSLLNRRGTARKPELDILVNNLLEVLRQIEDIVKRYHNLGRYQKRTWDRVKFATEDLAALRAKLSFHVNSIELFIASLSAGSLARIEVILDELVQDIKAGRKEPTVISTCEDDDEVAWSELERELVGDGITRQDVEKYKEDIKEYLKKLIQENLMGVGSGSSDSLSANFDDLRIEGGTSERYPLDLRQSRRLRSIRGSSTPGFTYQQDPILAIPERQRGHLSRKYWQSSDRHRGKSRETTQNSNVDGADQQVEWVDSASNVTPASLKGLFSVSTTTVKPVFFIRTDIIRVLKQLGVEYVEIRGGFSCSHVGYLSKAVEIPNENRSSSFESQRKTSFGGFNGSDGRDPKTSSQTSPGGVLVLDFEISIVKVPLLSLHGIQFKRFAGGAWQYKEMADQILGELRKGSQDNRLEKGMADIRYRGTKIQNGLRKDP